MNTVVTLNLARVVQTGAPTPAYAVADLIPVGEGGVDRVPIEGVVLELRDGSKLRNRLRVPPGSVVVNVKFPNGALLTQQVEVSGGDASISFALSGLSGGSARGGDGGNLTQERTASAASAPRRYGPQPRPETRDRARWRVQALEPRVGGRSVVWDTLADIGREVVSARQANLGVAKFRTNAPPLQPRVARGGGFPLDPLTIIGDASAVQPIKLYGDIQSLTTQWKAPLWYGPRARSGPDDEGRLGRYFAVVYKADDAATPLQVACIPGWWRRTDGQWATLRARFDPVALSRREESRIHIAVDDPQYGTLLEYLQTGDIESSAALFVNAREGLRQKFENPYAAAAGGYVLLYSGMTEESERWEGWIANLAHSFPSLPDGSILLATMLLQSPIGAFGGWASKTQRYSNALQAALEAVRRGPPLYRLGLILMASNLQILEGIYRNESSTVEQVRRARDYVQALSLRADPTQPFCVFDVEADAVN